MHLTPQQRKALTLLGFGLSEKEAARRMGLAYGTVRQILQRARDQNGARTTAHLAALTLATPTTKTDTGS